MEANFHSTFSRNFLRLICFASRTIPDILCTLSALVVVAIIVIIVVIVVVISFNRGAFLMKFCKEIDDENEVDEFGNGEEQPLAAGTEMTTDLALLVHEYE